MTWQRCPGTGTKVASRQKAHGWCPVCEQYIDVIWTPPTVWLAHHMVWVEGGAMTIGSLCSGIGGLELGLAMAGLGEVVWQSEVDPHASSVLARHWPGVPNLGDLRTAGLAPVDVVCAGFPCQPVSLAGKRKGLDDERWLFDDIAEALGRMEPPPRLLVFENVAGLLSAGCGDAVARVLHRLAALSYVGRWRTVRASDVGAPHRRERVFIVAHAEHHGRNGGTVGRGAGNGTNQRRVRQPQGHPASAPAHAERRPAQLRRGRGVLAGESRIAEGEGDQRERGGDAAGDSGTTVALGERPGADGVLWGQYAAAIARWERVFGRPAPNPLDDRGRLAPQFVEWMMGFPPGWVDGLPRTAALRCLGNAVVPQQAALAVRLLLAHLEAVA